MQLAEGVLGHAFGQVDRAEVVEDLDAADELRRDVALVRDGADDVAGVDAVLAADFDAVADHAGLVARAGHRLAFAPVAEATTLIGAEAAAAIVAARGAVAGKSGALVAKATPLIGTETSALIIARATAAIVRPKAAALGARAAVVALKASAAVVIAKAAALRGAVVAVIAPTVATAIVHVAVVLVFAAFAALDGAFGLEQERRIARGHLGQGGRDLDEFLAGLGGDLLDDARVHRAVFAGVHRFLDALFEAIDARRVHLVGRRDRVDLQLAAGGALDRREHAAFVRLDEQDRVALAAGAARAANAVRVRLDAGRQVIVEHVRNALDVEAAGGHVGGDDDVELAFFKTVDGALALLLRDVAIERRDGVTARAEFFSELGRVVFRARKDQHRVVCLGLEDAGERVELEVAPGDQVALANRRRDSRFDFELDEFGIAQVGLGEALDFHRHRRGKQHDLAVVGGFREDRVDVVNETHLEHLVGFVEDKVAHARQVEAAALEVVDHAAGGADDDVDAALERSQLEGVGLAAVDRQHAKALEVVGVLLKGFGDLDGELARRREHDRLGLAALEVDLGQDRQSERGGLAGAGLGLAEEVAAGEQLGNRRGLNRRRRLVADGGEGLFERGDQTEVLKVHGYRVDIVDFECLGHLEFWGRGLAALHSVTQLKGS